MKRFRDIIQDIKVIVNFILSEYHISIKSNFLDAILRNSPFEEGFSKQTNNLGNNTLVGFEGRVILDGSQTYMYLRFSAIMFESRVIFRWVSNSGRYHRRKRRV